MGWCWLLFLTAVLFTLLLFLPVTIHLRYCRGKENEHLSLRFSFLFFSYTCEFPRARPQTGAESNAAAKSRENRREDKEADGWVPARISHYLRVGKNLLEHIHHDEPSLRSFLKWFHITEFSWHTEIGTGEAASTGMLSGFLWTIKGSLLAILSRFFSLQALPQMTVSPHFQQAVLSTRVSCIIRFCVGQAMTAGIRIAYFWLREAKAWRNIQSKV